VQQDELFKTKDISENFFLKTGMNEYELKVRNNYYDHNGIWLDNKIIESRDKALKRDLIDIADMIREGLTVV